MVYGAVKTTINDQGVVWVYGEGHKGVRFCVGGCVPRECVVEGGGLYGYFGDKTHGEELSTDALLFLCLAHTPYGICTY